MTVDVLVSFEEDAMWGWKVVDAKEELEEIIGRKIDFIERDGVEQSKNWIRRKSILEEAEPYFVQR